ncbi:MAG: PAS domain S-box protein [bacterium]|nr:PAS domain S-box protein [bacterium]
MNEIRFGKKEIAWLTAIMAVVSLACVSVASLILYEAAFEVQEQRLLETVKGQARLIESINMHNARHESIYKHGEDPFENTLKEISEARSNFKGFGETGEFTIAELKDNKVNFLLKHRDEEISFGNNGSGSFAAGASWTKPMKAALDGKSGTMVVLGYRGGGVLAAYEPVMTDGGRVGIVAKIDIDEMRAPFIRASLFTVLIGIFLLWAGLFLFRRISIPLIKELMDREERFRSTFEQAAVGMAHISKDGHWLYVNKKLCDLVGYSRKELLARTFQEITYPQDLSICAKESDLMLSGEIDRYSAEKRYVRKDGSLLWVDVDISLVRKPTGDPKYFISVIKDVSARKDIEEELSQKKRLVAMGEMSAHMAHEIRNPLNSIYMAYQCLYDSKEISDEDKGSLKVLGAGIERLVSIATDLLDFGRSDKLYLETFDMSAMVNSAIYDFEDEAGKKGISLVKDLDFSLFHIEADEVKIRQVIINVIKNAIDAMNEGGVLTVKLERCGERMNITVSDTGAGMCESELQNIFIPFFTTKKNGTGLGMAIVKHFIELHEGEIAVESKIGEGTSFKISLPFSG